MSFSDVAAGPGLAARRPCSSRGVVREMGGADAVERQGTPESGRHTPSSYASTQGPSTALLNYQQQLTLFDRLVKLLGSHRDGGELRNQLAAQESVVKAVGQKVEAELGAQLRGSESLPNREERYRLRAENSKLTKDFRRLRDRFESSTRTASARIRELEQYALSERGGADGRDAGLMSPSDAQKLQLQLAHDDIDERILQEREEEIMAINQSVLKVNEIFRDLGELVHRQGEDIDRIEENVQQSHAAARSGLEQVEKAARYQPGCLIS